MNNITIYSQPDCPPCEIAKKFLTEFGFSFQIKDVKKDAIARNEMINKYQSFSTPTIVIGEEVITGFDLGRLKEVLKITE
ncbi:glutaredoxin family protein [Cytobacillus depressus]|uniref:Glutaredoxin family protein n=1 Tax=Cytobacillus depressus TaxID=1602942 RepID=A0A6L3V7B4_9BACI|nr:glutaredoxin family protein [Cytobacillus depressus]KAB2337334.1 glutaredoxin family protein [Cytobacillus depressus]